MRKWKPYCNPRDAGAWYSVSQMYPTSQQSYRSMPGFTAFATHAHPTPGTVQRAKAFGTADVVVGTDTKLWVNSSGIPNFPTFTDRSKALGYSGGTDWSFAKFGNLMLAANGPAGSKIQSRNSTGSSAFADIAAAPKATIVVVQSNAVLAFNTDTADYQWHASDVGDSTNWTTGEAANGPIFQRPGPILDACAFRDYVLVFKADAIFRMRYVGGIIKWIVELVADGRGVPNKGSIVNLGDTLYFWDAQGPVAFDGVKFTDLTPDSGQDPITGSPGLISSAATIQAGTYLPLEKSIVWSAGGTTFRIYNIVSGAWGQFTAYKSDATQLTNYVLIQFESGRPVLPITNAAFHVVDLSDGVYYPSLLIAPTGISSSVKATPVGDEKRLTAWTGLIPILANPTNIPNSDATTVLGATDLKLNIRTAKNPYHLGSNVTYGNSPSGVTTFSGNPITSADSQIRFSFTVTDRWAEFQVVATGKFFEIQDILPIGVAGGAN